MGISLQAPNGYFGHIGIFAEEISDKFGVGFEFEFIENAQELARLIAIEFDEFEIEFREEDYDHWVAEIRKEMRKCLTSS